MESHAAGAKHGCLQGGEGWKGIEVILCRNCPAGGRENRDANSRLAEMWVESQNDVIRYISSGMAWYKYKGSFSLLYGDGMLYKISHQV